MGDFLPWIRLTKSGVRPLRLHTLLQHFGSPEQYAEMFAAANEPALTRVIERLAGQVDLDTETRDLDLLLAVFPGLAIGSAGPCRSVLLVSSVPLDDIRSVSFDPESRTSNALVQVLCHEAWGVSPRFTAGPRDLDLALTEHQSLICGKEASGCSQLALVVVGFPPSSNLRSLPVFTRSRTPSPS